jgi:hypothetical protein
MRKRHLRIRPVSGRSGRFRPLGLELLEPRTLLAGVPLGALPQDTGEYMLGDVAVTLVLMESTGAESSEDWTSDSINAAKAKIQQALTWWEDTLAAKSSIHSVRFHLDLQYADNPVPTDLEPIAHISNDYSDWVNDFLDYAGANTSAGTSTDIRLLNHQQRVAIDADWGFTIFVVNDENDADGMFASGGSFRRAFAFAGGRYFIVPAGRPVLSSAHEIGHMFWARDEYAGGGSTSDRRGYYNTQNLNAAADPQLESIMTSGSLMQSAFDNHTSSPSSLEMIGWKDSDQDGIFDVLDVPLLLAGTGYADPATGSYRFQGTSRVQAIANRNPSGLQSDITLNRVDLVEYRIDTGDWQTAATPGEAVVSIDVSFSVPAGDHQVQVRTRSIDSGTGQTLATSNILVGNSLVRSVTQQVGIAGYVFADGDEDGGWSGGEVGLPGWTVQIVDSGGESLELWTVAEPDDFNDVALLNQAFPGLSLRAMGGGTTGDTVYSRVTSQASTWGRVFANHNSSVAAVRTTWNGTSRQLRMDFDQPVTAVRIDAIGNGGEDYGRLEIYDSQATLLARYTTGQLSDGEVETMLLVRPQGDIAYAVARAHDSSEIHLDQLRFGAAAQTTTDTAGAFWFDELEVGTYHVQVVPPAAWTPTEPASSTRQLTLTTGQLPGQLSFGVSAPAWHRVVNRFDVNADDSIVPLDALIVINDLNTLGARSLPAPGGELVPPPYLDVNGDGSISSIDALQVINELNAQLVGESTNEPVELSFHALAVMGEGEGLMATRAEAGNARNSLDQAWADVRFVEDLAPRVQVGGADLQRMDARGLIDQSQKIASLLELKNGVHLGSLVGLEWSLVDASGDRGESE